MDMLSRLLCTAQVECIRSSAHMGAYQHVPHDHDEGCQVHAAMHVNACTDIPTIHRQGRPEICQSSVLCLPFVSLQVPYGRYVHALAVVLLPMRRDNCTQQVGTPTVLFISICCSSDRYSASRKGQTIRLAMKCAAIVHVWNSVTSSPGILTTTTCTARVVSET